MTSPLCVHFIHFLKMAHPLCTHNYLIDSMEQEKLVVHQLVKKFPALFETVSTRTRKIQTTPCATFRNKLFFYGEELLALHQTPKLQDHHLSAVRDCLFNIFAATLHIWMPYLPSATRKRPRHGDRDLQVTSAL
jgi:hypothetical protein